MGIAGMRRCTSRPASLLATPRLLCWRAGGTIDQARLLAGRALAWEGIYEWTAALRDYNRALDMAAAVDKRPDPYVLNSRGNVRASLGDWAGVHALRRSA